MQPLSAIAHALQQAPVLSYAQPQFGKTSRLSFYPHLGLYWEDRKSKNAADQKKIWYRISQCLGFQAYNHYAIFKIGLIFVAVCTPYMAPKSRKMPIRRDGALIQHSMLIAEIQILSTLACRRAIGRLCCTHQNVDSTLQFNTWAHLSLVSGIPTCIGL